jgi:GTP:adenosylcobinamide-phosphate guanylyltransferase
MSLTICIPMAGKATRLGSSEVSKPLQCVDDIPMFLRVIHNLPKADRYIFLVHDKDEDTVRGLTEARSDAEYITVASQGRFKSIPEDVQLSLSYIKDGSVIVAHADQLLNWSPEHFMHYADRAKHMIIPVVLHHTVGAGFVAIDGLRGRVRDIVPKVSTDMFGLCGVYYFPDAQVCNEAVNRLGEDDMIGGSLYMESGLRRMLFWGREIDYYPIRNLWTMDTRFEIETVERMKPWQI